MSYLQRKLRIEAADLLMDQATVRLTIEDAEKLEALSLSLIHI